MVRPRSRAARAVIARKLAWTRFARRFGVLVLRAFVVVLSIHLSGGVHAIDDVTGRCSAQLEGSSDCPCDERSDCPPGCPNCHGHGIAALPRRAEGWSTLPALPDRPRPAFESTEPTAPASPDLAGPFRPPQHA